MDESRPSPARGLARWVPGDGPPDTTRDARLRLAAAIRRMNHLLMDADLSAEEYLSAAEGAEAFADRLAAGPRGALLWGFAETSNAGDPRAFFDRSPVIGLGNAIAPPLRLGVEGNAVVGSGAFDQAYEGPPGHVHGGWIAAAFDEVLGMAQSLGGNPGMTGTLTVRYRRPTPLGTDLSFRAWVTKIEGRKTFTHATLHAGDALCAEAEGLFIAVDFSRLGELAEAAGRWPESRA